MCDQHVLVIDHHNWSVLGDPWPLLHPEPAHQFTPF